MVSYANLSGQSNVRSYQIGDDFIVVEFMSGRETIYTYTHTSAGNNAIEQMKVLAVQGKGLNSYISSNKPGYSQKN